MWLAGYWMEHGGFRPEEIFALSPTERTVWQAIAELNSEQRYQDMKNAMIEAFDVIIGAIAKK